MRYSFANSRPAGDLFPLDDFRASCQAVLDRPELAGILQLGSPRGYEPLRRYLLESVQSPGDSIIGLNFLGSGVYFGHAGWG